MVAEDLDRVVHSAEAALDRLSGRTVLVAGGAGFLAGCLVEALAWANEVRQAPPCRIICLDSFTTGVPERLAHLAGRRDVQLRRADIVQGVEPGERVDYFVHAASIASPVWYRRLPLETIDVNVTGTRRLLDAARTGGAAGFLYFSSSEIYGDPAPDAVPTPEDYRGSVSCTGPRACYDESKRLAETLCATYHRLSATPVRIARPFNVYGPGMRLDDGRVMPDFIANALQGRTITLLSDGRATRSFCYVSDAVTALLHLLVAPGADGEAFNVGNDEEVAVRDLALLVARLGGSAGRIAFATSDDPAYLVDNPVRRCPDLRKIRSATGWSPAVDLRAGVERTLRHYRQAGDLEADGA